MAGVAMIAAVFYAFRLVTFVSAGPTSEFYLTWAGPNPTTLLVLVLLVVVTYTVGVLSQLEMSLEWRLRAANDDLTGLLGRSAFTERAQVLLDRARVSGTLPTVVLADFDHFKSLNDAYGHAAGDRALEAFGLACRRLLAADDLACRMGGEEFVLMSNNADTSDAEELTAALSLLFAELMGPDAPRPTVSYGIAHVDKEWSLNATIQRADQAMYQAKRSGRDRTAVDGATDA
jgi:diguanylate cyclase (GGDEF)-like protein